MSRRMCPGARTSLKFFPCLILAWLLLAGTAAALDVPKLAGRVNDYASILSPATVSQLDSVLRDLETSDSTQIVVLTIPSLEGDSLERFSLNVAEQWQIGQSREDNGALLLIAVDDRKIRIEIGYGLEGTLTDLVSGQIIRNIISPHFRRGNFNQGVIDGVGAMIAAVKGEYQATATSGTSTSGGQDIGGLITAMFFILFFFGSMFRDNKTLAGIIGGTATPVMGYLLFGITGLALLGLVFLGGIGGLIASSMAGSSRSRQATGRTGPFYIPASGGLGGTSGGFGGFSGGGGGFGGGGASGGW